MLFPTIEFAIFLAIVFASYWLLRKRPLARKLLLLLASYVFYGAWDWRFTFLLAGVSSLNWLAGLLITKSPLQRRKKAWLAAALVLNLGVLAFFKYFLFLATSLNNLFLPLGLGAPIPIPPIILPVGISFFTFQGMSYAIDVFRGKLEASRSPLDAMLFVAFFPQLVAGPIVRGADFLPQITRQDALTPLETPRAFLLIMGGLFKKVILANHLAQSLVDPVFSNPLGHSGPTVLLALYGYALQIYCDFSAYSDIAIGVALLFGFRFPDNFDQPYRASSLREFWRRWHISLSSWLRDYLYIPLGGNRKGRLRSYLNLFLTMLLGGLWHGAAWTFVIWGALHGLGLVVERLVSDIFKRPADGARAAPRRRSASTTRLMTGLKTFLTFHFVCLCWIFFRAGGLGSARAFLLALAKPFDPSDLPSSFVMLVLAAAALTQILPRRHAGILQAWFADRPPFVQALVMASFLFGLGVLSPSGVAPFIYFRF